MRTKRNAGLFLTAVVALSACGGGGKLSGKLGTQGLQGTSSDNRCIANTEMPFGAVAVLSAQQRQEVYLWLKRLKQVNHDHDSAQLVSYDPNIQSSTPLVAALAQEAAEGKCQAQFGVVDDVMVQSLTGASCSVTAIEKSANEQLSSLATLIKSEESFRYNALGRSPDAVLERSSKQDHLISKHGEVSGTQMHLSTCAVKKGELKLVDGTTVAMHLSQENYMDYDSLSDPNAVTESHTRHLLKLPNFTVLIEETSKGSVNSLTLNGEAVNRSEVEAAGLEMRDLGSVLVGGTTN